MFVRLMLNGFPEPSSLAATCLCCWIPLHKPAGSANDEENKICDSTRIALLSDRRIYQRYPQPVGDTHPSIPTAVGTISSVQRITGIAIRARAWTNVPHAAACWTASPNIAAVAVSSKDCTVGHLLRGRHIWLAPCEGSNETTATAAKIARNLTCIETPGSSERRVGVG